MRQGICAQWMAAVLMVCSAVAAHATDGVVAGDAYVNSAHPTTNYGTYEPVRERHGHHVDPV